VEKVSFEPGINSDVVVDDVSGEKVEKWIRSYDVRMIYTELTK